uniref:Uncharacterized protein n=1 Tax=viral metagenome TaxID=1070528 RepID=A0A6M3LJ09_9ZZZZ
MTIIATLVVVWLFFAALFGWRLALKRGGDMRDASLKVWLKLVAVSLLWPVGCLLVLLQRRK